MWKRSSYWNGPGYQGHVCLRTSKNKRQTVFPHVFKLIKACMFASEKNGHPHHIDMWIEYANDLSNVFSVDFVFTRTWYQHSLGHPMSLRRSAKSTDRSPSNTGFPHGNGKRAAKDNVHWTLDIAAYIFSTLFTANALLHSMPVKVEYWLFLVSKSLAVVSHIFLVWCI